MKKQYLAAIGAMLALVATSCNASKNVVVTTTADSGVGSLRDAVDRVEDGGVITFKIKNKADSYDGGIDKWIITLTSGEIKFRKSIIIKGDGKIVIDGNKASRIFDFVGTGTLTLDNLVFINGNATDDDDDELMSNCGGIVRARGSVIVSNCILVGSSAKNAGAVIASESPIIATRCTFSGNSTKEHVGVVATMSISATDCTFIDNSSYGSFKNDGVIFANSVSVTNCTFIGNCSFGDYSNNGVIHAFDSISAVNCIFADNMSFNKKSNVEVSEFRGDAMRTNGRGSISAINCVFTGDYKKSSYKGAVSTEGTFSGSGCSFNSRLNIDEIGDVVHAGDIKATNYKLSSNVKDGRDRSSISCVFSSTATEIGSPMCVFLRKYHEHY